MATGLKERIEYGIVNKVADKVWNPGRQTSQNLTGSNHTTVELCDDNATNVWYMYDIGGADRSSFPIAGNTARKRCEVYYADGIDFFAARGWSDVISLSFENASDYAQLALSAAEDWTAGTANNDYLLFWLWSNRTFANTEFDLTLLDSTGAAIANADFTTPFAISAAKKWQLIVIDTSTPTLNDVQYIRIQHDVSTQTELRICDIVRTDANCITNSYYKDLILSTNLGCVGRFLHAYLTQMEADNTAHIHINSLANHSRPLYPSVFYDCINEPIAVFFIHGMTSDTLVTLDIHANGRWQP